MTKEEILNMNSIGGYHWEHRDKVLKAMDEYAQQQLAEKEDEVEKLKSELSVEKTTARIQYKNLLTLQSTVAEKHSQLQSQTQRIKDLEEAMQEFVDRVERGEVRSKKTYAKYKQLLNKKQ